ncbi:MAG: T9SS type A sorting domain-containing protein, partial [Bacteroidia bacterium]|nr:T9SS type A sorting domain-containing protein [Bacteroidia bacterium]
KVNSKITVYDAIGQIIYTSIITESKETINISNVPNGIYMIQIKSENSIITKKVIKKD